MNYEFISPADSELGAWIRLSLADPKKGSNTFSVDQGKGLQFLYCSTDQEIISISKVVSYVS